MYTGVVEATGRIESNTQVEDGCRLRIETETAELEPDNSINISGVCLTAEAVGDGWFDAFLSAETVSRTYLANAAVGEQVNIERPLETDGQLDGHVVKGTVDTVVNVADITSLGEDWQFTFTVPDGYEQYLVNKGAVALDGASLTVTDLTEETFTVAIVPQTYEITTFSDKQVGDPIHFEADILAKYIERQQALAGHSESCRASESSG
ncbi:riboflavin synthase [Halovenus rubra]|uniref:Riboflavin synthase n=2 Tax=Halovenus rubra TaxID=869890 RepID=A0ABD5XDV8_9EURY|nr:riboflavin synthase [Halovenus rubra]